MSITFPSKANIIADNTLRNASDVSFSASDKRYTVSGGVRPENGPNLFHSFREFNLFREESAYFLNPEGVERIFSRVTGDIASEIDGILGVLDQGSADLFFLNPNGIIFGRNARLDVNGSFIASTADAIRFPGNSLFSSSDTTNDVLLSVQPNAFLFNVRPNADLARGLILSQSVENPFDLVENYRGLAVPEGQMFGLVGGRISLERSAIEAPNGRIELGSVADGSVVSLIATNGLYEFVYHDRLISGFEDLTLTRANVRVDGRGQGTIQAVGRNITLDRRSILQSRVTVGVLSQNAGRISVTAQERLDLAARSKISSSLADSTITRTGTDISVSANSVIVNSMSEISANLFSGMGTGGSVMIQARNILVSGAAPGIEHSLIASQTRSDSSGQAGPLRISTENLTIADGGQVTTTLGRGGGRGGDLSIYATGTVEIRGDSSLLTSDVVKDGTGGQAGNLTIETNRLSVADRGRISTSLLDTRSSIAQAGTLTIQANNIEIEGIGTDVEEWDRLTNEVSDGLIVTGILSETNPGNAGDAGPINIDVDGALMIRNGGGIAATAQTAKGRGEDIVINAERLFLDGGNILTGTSQTDSGDITLKIADLLFLQNDSVISTSAGQIGADGNGGDITIEIPRGVLAALPRTNSDITANAFNDLGGRVIINAQGIVGLRPRSRDELSQLLNTDTPEELDSRRLQSNDMTAISQANPDLSGEIIITANADPSRTDELPSGLTDASNQIEQTVCRATQGSEFWVTGQGGVLPSPREQFRSEDLWEDWRLMEIAEEPSVMPSLVADPTDAVSAAGIEVAIRTTHRQTNAPPLPAAAAAPLLEAQGWQTNNNGDIILVADAASTNGPSSLPRIPGIVPPNATCQTHSPVMGGPTS